MVSIGLHNSSLCKDASNDIFNNASSTSSCLGCRNNCFKSPSQSKVEGSGIIGKGSQPDLTCAELNARTNGSDSDSNANSNTGDDEESDDEMKAILLIVLIPISLILFTASYFICTCKKCAHIFSGNNNSSNSNIRSTVTSPRVTTVQGGSESNSKYKTKKETGESSESDESNENPKSKKSKGAPIVVELKNATTNTFNVWSTRNSVTNASYSTTVDPRTSSDLNSSSPRLSSDIMLVGKNSTSKSNGSGNISMDHTSSSPRTKSKSTPRLNVNNNTASITIPMTVGVSPRSNGTPRSERVRIGVAGVSPRGGQQSQTVTRTISSSSPRHGNAAGSSVLVTKSLSSSSPRHGELQPV